MRMLKQIAGALAAAMCIAGAANGQVVISQVYGGGGNSGATYTHDFIELKNIGAAPQSLAGWSVQYAGSTGSTWTVTSLTAVTLQPGQYYLIQQAQGAGGTTSLPTPDASGSIAMSGTAGKVALVSSVTALSGTCPTAGVLDFVGYGSATNCAEGTPTGTLSNTTAAIRLNGGCQDNGDNLTDFQIAAPTPRNTGTTYTACGGTPPTGMGSPTPFVVCNGTNVQLDVTVTPGSSPASTGITVVGNLSPLGGSGTQSFTDLGGNNFRYTQTVGVGISAGLKTISMTVSDAQGRNSTFTTDVIVNRCTPSSTGLIEPQALCTTTGGMARVVVFVNPATSGMSAFAPGSITADLSLIGGSVSQTLYDDGTNGDRLAADNAWTFELPVAAMPVSVRTITWSGADADARPISGMSQIQFINCTSAASDVVVSQVYGGGGNLGATYTNDFIELFNRGQVAVDLTGWSVQYASETGGFSNKTDLPAFVLQPGQYFLIQEAAGAGGTDPLPTPDATGGINMSATTGKIAVVSSTTLINSNCADPAVRDLVAYGAGVTCFEGLFPAPNAANAVSLLRLQAGCQDTNQNAPDFYPGTVTPRNSATAFNVCSTGPATGGCCLPDGMCSVMTATACTAANGSYLGNSQACNQISCDALSVACCLNNACVVTNRGGCLFQNGTVSVFGASCSGVVCGPQFCDADWCQDGSVGVPDIFCFLSDWFAFVPAARNYGGTNGVPAIFAFLSIWFATGQGPCTP